MNEHDLQIFPRGGLADNWTIRSLKRATLTTAFTRHYIERQAGPTVQDAYGVAELRYDQRGRLLASAWMTTAERL
ncbi:MAG: hypothetical protein ACRDRU_13280 [Pseudonocardiaceae bacterium]